MMDLYMLTLSTLAGVGRESCFVYERVASQRNSADWGETVLENTRVICLTRNYVHLGAAMVGCVPDRGGPCRPDRF